MPAGYRTNMKQDKIVITGHSGMLGNALIDRLVGKAELFGLAKDKNYQVKNILEHQIDLTDIEKTSSLIKLLSPNLIIHTAALTNVDLCEKKQELARQVNIEATRNLAKLASDLNAVLVYISTDFVFNGQKGDYKEDDQTSPINYYGLTKLKGEEAVKKNCRQFIITRNTLYGWNKIAGRKSLPERIIESNKNNEKFSPFTDHIFTPVYVDTLAEIIYDLYQKKLWGIWHIGSNKAYNKYEFGLKTAEVFNLDENLIKEGSSTDVHWLAMRPKKLNLNTAKLKKIAGIEVDLEADLNKMKADKNV